MTHIDDVTVVAALVRLAILGVLEQDTLHVRAGVLEQLVVGAEDDQRDLTVAQHRELVRLLHQAELALGERHLEATATKDRHSFKLVFQELLSAF